MHLWLIKAKPGKAEFGLFIVGSEDTAKNIRRWYRVSTVYKPCKPQAPWFLATPSPVSLCHWHTAARAPQNQLLLERGKAHMKTRPPGPPFNCSGRMAKWMMKDLYYVVKNHGMEDDLHTRQIDSNQMKMI